jgi:hypothetical protein
VTGSGSSTASGAPRKRKALIVQPVGAWTDSEPESYRCSAAIQSIVRPPWATIDCHVSGDDQ